MDGSTFEIRLLESADEMTAGITVFQRVWGTMVPIVTTELLCAIAHAGGYVAGAFDSDDLIGASFGFLARHDDDDALHSHVTGILPAAQDSGVGRAIKLHQRQWATERAIPWITWTFDPLVRRNAWFNVEVLGAHVTEYLVNFYGVMTDSINSHDESDRLVVAWPTDSAAERPTPTGPPVIEVETPDDIVFLRRTDPEAAMNWRIRMRDELGGALAHGATVTAFTRSGAYVLRIPD